MQEFVVEGMTCSGCSNSVKKALQNIDPGADVSVDLPTKVVRVRSEASSNLLAQGIEAAGFEVIERRLGN